MSPIRGTAPGDSAMRYYIDLTEFLAEPHRTGIQRVGGELCRRWPDGQLTPTVLRDGRLLEMPAATLRVITDYFEAPHDTLEKLKAEIHDLQRCAGNPVDLTCESTRIVVSEVFYDPTRVQYFRSLP